MNTITLDSIENTIRSEDFIRKVTTAANDHIRITEPNWHLYDVKLRTDSHPIDGPRIALTLYFKDNGLALQ